MPRIVHFVVLGLLLSVALVAPVSGAGQCTVDPQATSAASISIEQISTTNKVRFMVNIPDEVHTGADNTFNSFEFVHGLCPYIAWNNLAMPEVVPTDVGSATEISDGYHSWLAYKETTGACDTIHMFVDLNVSQILECLTYTTTDGSGNLLYEAIDVTLARYYSFSSTDQTTGVTNAVSSASIETKFNYQIAIQTVYSAMTAEAAMSISGDPLNPSSVAVFKQVSVSAATEDKRTYTIEISTKSRYPFELRTDSSTGIDTATLTSFDGLQVSSATFVLNTRCPNDATYDADGDQCDQVLTLTVVAAACSFSNLAINFPNDKLYYGCASGTNNTGCPLLDDTTTTLGTFATPTPLSITLNSGDRCALGSNTINFAASLSLSAKAVTGLLGSAGTWDTTQRERTLHNTAGFLYFDVEATNIASVTTIDQVVVDGVNIITVNGTARASTLSGFDAYLTDNANCNVTLGTGVGSFFRVCLRVPMSSTNFPDVPPVNGKISYGFSITATIYLRDGAITKRRSITATQPITSKASTSISVLSETAAQAPGAGASASTIAIGATIGVVALAAVVGAIVVGVIALKARNVAGAAKPVSV